MGKPNCYDCIYRGEVAGSAHSCCNHPTNAGINSDPLAQIFGIFASVGRVTPLGLETASPLNIKGNAHGILSGWFNWPLNFDPTWLESCDGFTPEGGEKDETKNDLSQSKSRVESVSQSVLQRDESNERPITSN